MRWPDDYKDPSSVVFPDDRWDPDFKKHLAEAEKLLDRLNAIHLAGPPDIPTTRGELDAIASTRLASDFAARIPAILDENRPVPPPSLFQPLGAEPGGPHRRTAKVVGAVVEWSLPYIMYFKARWRRARPDHLEPFIHTAFGVPGHPAYPSGHSTQSHLIALVGYEVCRDPAIRATLWAAAERIAQNREYAGVHYRSDSACGVELAHQLLPFFIEDHQAELLEARKAEWPQA